MRRMRAAPAVIAAGLLAVTPLAGSLAGCGGGVLSPDVVLVNGGEPPNPLIPDQHQRQHWRPDHRSVVRRPDVL